MNPPHKLLSLSPWARQLVTQYESGAANQFLLYGNIHDRFVFGDDEKKELGDLKDFLLRVLMSNFDVVLSYGIGDGLRLEKGHAIFSNWPTFKELKTLPKPPLPAIDLISHYFRYAANLAEVKTPALSVGCLIQDVQLIAPPLQGGFSYEIAALASQIRGWTIDALFVNHSLVSFLLADNLSDLHPLIATNPRVARVDIPLPSTEQLHDALALFRPRYASALAPLDDKLDRFAAELTGATLRSVESLMKTKQYEKEPLVEKDLSALKKRMVERDCNGLIEFLAPQRTLDDICGLDKVKAWLRQDLSLWKQNDLQALPKGYLICGPVGTGKTYLVECLAGEAGVPVVKLKNFRDKWVGSSEGNLERIFRLLQALGRCYVFIDEADQALGKRESGSGDSGLSGRIYSMIAEEMSKSENRGRIIWILASSRPDLTEVDLKRPGRVDVKIPLFPTSTIDESFTLMRNLLARRNLNFTDDCEENLRELIPTRLTPGTAETLSVKAYRLVKTEGKQPLEALRLCLADFQDPVPRAVMDFQIRLAIEEASDRSFVPSAFLIPP